MGRVVAFFGMLLEEQDILTEASLFRARPNHVHSYFIKYPAAEYATPKPDGNLTRLHTWESLGGETITSQSHDLKEMGPVLPDLSQTVTGQENELG